MRKYKPTAITITITIIIINFIVLPNIMNPKHIIINIIINVNNNINANIKKSSSSSTSTSLPSVKRTNSNEDLEKAIEESILSFENDIKKSTEISPVKQVVNLPKIKVQRRINLVSPPSDDDDDSDLPNKLENIYSLLKEQNFSKAKEEIASIKKLKNVEWVKTLQYEGQPLKKLLISKSSEAYKCLEK